MVAKHEIEGARAPWNNIIVGGPFKLVGKHEIEGARALWINIIIDYCCTRVLLYAKMLKETEETIVFFVTFLSLVAFQLGGAGPLGPPLATPMNSKQICNHRM